MHDTKRSFGLLRAVLALGLALPVTGCSEEDNGSSGSSGSGSTSDDDDGDDTSAVDDDDDAGGSSSSSDDDDTTTSSGGSTSSSSSSGGSTSSGSGTTTNAAVCPGIPLTERADYLTTGEDAACTGLELEPESLPVDLFLMMDRSESMTYEHGDGIRWDGVRDAVAAFVDHPQAADIGIGFGYFNLNGGVDEAGNCNAGDYADPVVAIGLPADTGEEILSVMDGLALQGWTPTLPALEGAIEYAKEYHADHPERETVVVLVTDGMPTLCSMEEDTGILTLIAEAAAEGYSSDPSIRTYIVGIAAGFNLNSWARAGGTGEAYVVDETEDVSTALLDRLLTLSSSALACNFELPPLDTASQEVDPNQVVVTFDSPLGDPEEIPRVSSEEACASSSYGGWYFKDPDSPMQISLCPCTCARTGGGVITVAAGCNPIILLG